MKRLLSDIYEAVHISILFGWLELVTVFIFMCLLILKGAISWILAVVVFLCMLSALVISVYIIEKRSIC